ncbi:Mg2+ transporter protein [Diplocarpon rosae]|nr:Mg2+ transporter protein [Diplocarpon rosae]
MIASFSIVLTLVSFSLASLLERRVATSKQAASEEAQQKDEAATRAFPDSEIKCLTADGKRLFVNELSGDFRATLMPIQVANSGDSAGQEWDIITKGKKP